MWNFPEAPVCVEGGALSRETNAPTMGDPEAFTTFPPTEPKDCAADGLARKEIAATLAQNRQDDVKRFDKL